MGMSPARTDAAGADAPNSTAATRHRMTPPRGTDDGGLIGSACVTTRVCARFATGLEARRAARHQLDGFWESATVTPAAASAGGRAMAAGPSWAA